MPISRHREYIEMMTHFMPSNHMSITASISDAMVMSIMRLLDCSNANMPKKESGIHVNTPAEPDLHWPSTDGAATTANRKAIIRNTVTAFLTGFDMPPFYHTRRRLAIYASWLSLRLKAEAYASVQEVSRRVIFAAEIAARLKYAVANRIRQVTGKTPVAENVPLPAQPASVAAVFSLFRPVAYAAVGLVLLVEEDRVAHFHLAEEFGGAVLKRREGAGQAVDVNV